MAAVDALSRQSRLGSEAAFELIVTAMIEAEDQVQRAAAEALAGLGPEGEAVLRDAARDQDLVIRRAAVYGLSVVGTPWSQELLQELQQDEEWLVRNAAINALGVQPLGEEELSLPELALPEVETEPWLIAWAAERGEGTGVGDAALATLTRALVEGEPAIRQTAIETLERLADPRSVDLLRQLLRDPEPNVRQAALMALEEISRRHDMTITAGGEQ
jgi:HEAT repeat protein